eukprot:scaffold4851_cov428-Prasinococcus_capsulatus_cf.AAC.20
MRYGDRPRAPRAFMRRRRPRGRGPREQRRFLRAVSARTQRERGARCRGYREGASQGRWSSVNRRPAPEALRNVAGVRIMQPASLAGPVVLVAVHVQGLLALARRINQIVALPYMDEVFHVPQAQQYCLNSNFHAYDQKLTTPPGLYLLHYAYSRVQIYVSQVTGSFLNLEQGTLGEEGRPAMCSIGSLRGFNIVLGAACLPVFALFIRRNEPGQSSLYVILKTMLLALHPLHFFFSFLFYTDVGSTFLVLSTHLLILARRPILSGATAAASILFRQTNIVWLAFSTGEAMLELIYSKPMVVQASPALLSLVDTADRLWTHRKSALLVAMPLIVHSVLFCAFVYYNNGSIVLGEPPLLSRMPLRRFLTDRMWQVTKRRMSPALI